MNTHGEHSGSHRVAQVASAFACASALLVVLSFSSTSMRTVSIMALNAILQTAHSGCVRSMDSGGASASTPEKVAIF